MVHLMIFSVDFIGYPFLCLRKKAVRWRHWLYKLNALKSENIIIFGMKASKLKIDFKLISSPSTASVGVSSIRKTTEPQQDANSAAVLKFHLAFSHPESTISLNHCWTTCGVEDIHFPQSDNCANYDISINLPLCANWDRVSFPSLNTTREFRRSTAT